MAPYIRVEFIDIADSDETMYKIDFAWKNKIS